MMCVTLDVCVAGVKRPKVTMLEGLCPVRSNPVATKLVPEPGPDISGMKRSL